MTNKEAISLIDLMMDTTNGAFVYLEERKKYNDFVTHFIKSVSCLKQVVYIEDEFETALKFEDVEWKNIKSVKEIMALKPLNML